MQQEKQRWASSHHIMEASCGGSSGSSSKQHPRRRLAPSLLSSWPFCLAVCVKSNNGLTPRPRIALSYDVSRLNTLRAGGRTHPSPHRGGRIAVPHLMIHIRPDVPPKQNVRIIPVVVDVVAAFEWFPTLEKDIIVDCCKQVNASIFRYGRFPKVPDVSILSSVLCLLRAYDSILHMCVWYGLHDIEIRIYDMIQYYNNKTPCTILVLKCSTVSYIRCIDGVLPAIITAGESKSKYHTTIVVSYIGTVGSTWIDVIRNGNPFQGITTTTAVSSTINSSFTERVGQQCSGGYSWPPKTSLLVMAGHIKPIKPCTLYTLL